MYVRKRWEINTKNLVRLRDRIINKVIFKEINIMVYKTKKIRNKISHLTIIIY
jgi:hypothetical protein